MIRTHFWIFALFISLFFLFVYRDLLTYRNLVYVDLSAFRPLGESLDIFRSIWNPQSLGYPNNPMNNHLLTGFLSLLFFNNPDIVQKLFWLSLQPLSALFMYVYLIKFQKIDCFYARSFSSFFYAVNPVSLQLFSMGAAQFMLLYCFLPILLMFYSYLIRGKNILITVLFFSGMLAIVDFYARDALAIIIPITILYLLFFGVGHSHSIKNMSFTLICFGLYFVLSISFYLPLILSTDLFSGTFATTTFASLQSFIEGTYANSDPNNLFRLLGGHLEWYPYQIWGGSLLVLGYIFPVLSFLSFFIAEKKRRKNVIFFSVLALLAICFPVLVKSGFLWSAFESFSFLSIFRESYKLLVFIPLAFAPLMAFSLERVKSYSFSNLIFFRKKKLFLSLMFLGLTFSNISYNWLILSGDGGISTVTAKRYEVFGSLGDKSVLTTPDSYYLVSDWLNNKRTEEGFFRTLWLPIDRNIAVKVQSLDLYRLYPREKSLDNSDVLVRHIFDNILVGNSDVSHLLSLVNVKYVVVNKDSLYNGSLRYGWTGEGIIGDPFNFIKVLDSDSNLQRVVDTNDYVIYENTVFKSHFSISSNLFVVNSQNLTLEEITENLRYLPDQMINDTSFVTESSEVINQLISSESISNFIFVEEQMGSSNSFVFYNSTMPLTLISNTESLIQNNLFHNVSLDEPEWSKASLDTVNSAFNFSNADISNSVIQFGINETCETVRFFLTEVTESNLTDSSYLNFKILDDLSPAVDSIILQVFDTNEGRADWIISDYLGTDEWSTIQINLNEPTAGSYGFNSSLPLHSFRFRVSTDGSGDGFGFLYFDDFSLSLINSALISDQNGTNWDSLYLKPLQNIVHDFEIPKQDFYNLLIRISSESQTLVEIDGKEIQTCFVSSEEIGYDWIQTEQFELTTGSHSVSITALNNDTKVDVVVFTSYLNSEPVSINKSIQIVSENYFEYEIDVFSDSPAFIEFGDSYHDDWIGLFEDDILLHFESGLWANGFYIENLGNYSLAITFEAQKIRDLSIIVQTFAWVSVILLICYVIFPKIKKINGILTANL